ncbi:MAG: outer membrane beta-barrel protein, partial [Enterovibrio sp.]
MKYKIIYLASLPLLFSVQAAASKLPFQSYWYAGIGLGNGYYSNGGNPLSYENQRNGFAGTAYLGYQFNPYLAPELSYQFLGNAHANYTQGQISGHFQQVVLAARAGYPLTSWLYPYAKIGGASWFGESKGLRIGDEQGFSPIAAAGIEYAITSRLVAQLEYQYTDKLGADSIGYTDHHLTTIGLNWRFGQSTPEIPPAPEPEIIVQPVEFQPEIQTIAETQFIYSELKGQ